MSVSKYTLPPSVYLPSSGGYTSSRLASEPFHRRVFAFRRYSTDEDGRLVARTRGAARDARQKPYERPMNTIPPNNHNAPATGQDVPPRKRVDGATLSRLFQQLAPLTKDLLTFESKASAVCASFELDPATSTEIVGSFKQQLSADQTHEPRTPPAVTSGPTAPESIVERAPNTLALETTVSIPVRHQRPFISGPKGSTIWYTTASNQPISSPPNSLPASSGILYIHTDLSTKANQVWLCNINARWTDITTMDNVKHPSITDRVLLLRSDGIPSWLTSTNYATVQSRKEKAGR